jgi:hypothetical protein
MNTKFLALILFAAAILGPSAWSAGGVDSSGGGDVQHSTVEDVLHAIPGNYQYLLWEIIKEMEPGSPIQINNPNVRPIFQKLAALPLADDIIHKGDRAGIHFHLEKNGPCHDPLALERETDASVMGSSDKADICLSIPRLTHYPATGLQAEIGALIIHELTHVAGFGENDAIVAQEYVLKFMSRPCYYEVSYRNPKDKDAHRIEIILRDLYKQMARLDAVGLYSGPEVDVEKTVPLSLRYGYSVQTLVNRPEESKFDISSTKTNASFSAILQNGSIAQIAGSWAALVDQGKGGWFEIPANTIVQLNMNGSPLDVTSVGASSACFNDRP